MVLWIGIALTLAGALWYRRQPNPVAAGVGAIGFLLIVFTVLIAATYMSEMKAVK